jgi:hypothetical protein
MIKKISVFTIIFTMVFGMQLMQPKQAYAIDLDDPANILSSILGGVSTGEDVWQGIAKEVLEPAVKALADKMLSKLTQSLLTWANGGFDGDPSFINNWDDFLKGTEHEVLSSAFATASQSAQIAINQGGDPGQTAQDNWNAWQSGEASTARAIATTVASYGSQQLNGDPLNALLNGDGESLTTLLGSQSAKDAFKNDITVGGWEGYLALADPHNYDAGLQSLVKGALGQKTTEKVESAIDNLQTPQKFLDKVECEETDNVTGECVRKVSTTPGNQVGSLVSKSLTKELDQSINADGLIGSLVSALGKLTGGLIDGGINKVSKVAVGSFYNSEQQATFSSNNEFLQGGYQSEYDVLGIESDSTYINNDTTTNDINDLFSSQNGEAPFLGGPEDETGNWGEGPQVIIDFNKLLQINIDFAEEEFGYFKEMEQILIDTKDSAISLDRCLPGPDYNWEERWKDVMGLGDDQSDLGLVQTKKMFNDSRVNIPGSKHIYSSFVNLVGSTKSEAIRTKIRIDDLDKVRSTLGFIKAEINGRFAIQKLEVNENLILFAEEWEPDPTNPDDTPLSLAQKTELLELAIENNYYILKTSQGETVASALADNNIKVRDAIIEMGWDIWRTETPQEEKNDLRYSFFIIQTKLSSEQFLASAKAKLAQTRGSAISTNELLSDCLVFKAFALGTPVSQLNETVNNGLGAGALTSEEQLENQIQDLAQDMNELAGAFFLGGPLGGAIADAVGNIFGLGGSGNLPDPYTYLNINPHPSDAEIIEFLTEQNTLSITNDPAALFNSTKMTSAGSISQSILGFENEAAKRTYFNERYPDIGPNFRIGSAIQVDINGNPISSGPSGPFGSAGVGYPSRTRTNAYNVYEIFRQDDYYLWIYGGDDDPNITGQVSTLFCQHNGIFGTGATDGGLFGSGGLDHVNHSKCVKGRWSKASDLNYELVFAGI